MLFMLPVPTDSEWKVAGIRIRADLDMLIIVSFGYSPTTLYHGTPYKA